MASKKPLKIHEEDYTQVKCPVGPELIGLRHPWEVVELYCRDCNHTFKYEPYNSKPVSSFRGRKEDKECGCGVCSDR